VIRAKDGVNKDVSNEDADHQEGPDERHDPPRRFGDVLNPTPHVASASPTESLAQNGLRRPPVKVDER
jgi:hypothetical protein